MKSFEKWWDDRFPGNKEHHKIYHYREPKEAWEAALEWVQSRLKFGSGVAYSTDDILMAIKKEIREELED